MSDFLGRLAARHVAPPAIRPRAASRFEGLGVGPPRVASAATPSITPEHDIEAPATPRLRTRETERQVSPAEQRMSSLEGDTPAPRRTATSETEREPVLASSVRARVPHSSREVGADRVLESVATKAAPARVAESGTVHTVATKISSHGEVAVAQTRERGPSSSHDVRSGRVPDVVRVHIGRVEVRAVLPTPERPQQRTKQENGARPMSLDRYLGRDRA